ncbi:MAG: hypothetical protein ACOC1F_13375 [Myxococcota bacterium]
MSNGRADLTRFAGALALAITPSCASPSAPVVAPPSPGEPPAQPPALQAPAAARSVPAPEPSAEPVAAEPAQTTAAADSAEGAPAPAANASQDSCSGDNSRWVAEHRTQWDRAQPWSTMSPAVAADIAAGRPLVVSIVVPLCSNQQLWCGSRIGGDPVGLNSNIYWGAIFGARRFFDEYNSPYERIETRTGEGPVLERIVYRLEVPGEPWGKPAGEKAEQIVVLHAVHGSRINEAVERFWHTATRGGCVSFEHGGRTRTERVHVAGYAGHNRLMDNVKLPPAPAIHEASPIPSFVLACFSERYFGPSLRRAGARPLVTTRSYMAPEGYLVRAMAEGLAANEGPDALRSRAAAAQRSWQKSLSAYDSMWFFWPVEP